MGFLGLASVYMMRIKLSVAIVDIVKTGPSVDNATSFFGRSGGTSASNNSAQCEDQGSKSNESNGEFDWDGETQGPLGASSGSLFLGLHGDRFPEGF
nr:unnamed protein product [Daphnia galeata]